MGLKSAYYLLLLAAIWGASFLFMRISAPVLGGLWLIEGRVFFAAVALFCLVVLLRKNLEFRSNWRHYLLLGFMNASLPFFCYGFAAQSLTASLMSIVNALTPIFGTIISALYFRTKLEGQKVLGLLLGLLGVAVVVGMDPSIFSGNNLIAVFVVMGAPLSYGVSSVYIQVARKVDPMVNAFGTMLMASALMVPFLFFVEPNSVAAIDLKVVLSVLALGILCTGVAYLIFFKLLAEIGTSSTLTVTFLVPIFGVLWGVIFLGEKVGWYTFVGALLVLIGTAKVTGFSAKKVLK